MREAGSVGSDRDPPQIQGIRFLVESALRRVLREKIVAQDAPRGRADWLARLCAALTEDQDRAYEGIISAMIANGISSDEIYDRFIPEAARHLGEMWVQDKASFVDVTVGAARLQHLFRNRGAATARDWVDRSIPLGQSVLMVVPTFEDHSIGAFIVADQFRRHGLWVHMAIGLEREELLHLVGSGRFSMVGITAGSIKVLEPLTELIDYLRSECQDQPPIVVGGHIVTKSRELEKRIGADFVVRTAREAIERCGLSSVVQPISIDTNP